MNAALVNLTAATTSLRLLAQEGSFADMGRKFRRDSAGLEVSEILTLLLLMVAVGLTGWVLSRFLSAQDRPGFNSPRRMFRELCRAHRVDRRGRRLLQRLARHHGMDSAAHLFLQPERFNFRSLDPALQQQGPQIEKLRDALFGRRVGE